MKENDQAHYLKITQSFSGSVNGEQTTDISECLGTIPLYNGKRHITQPMSKSIECRRRFALIFFFCALVFHTNQYKPVK